MIAHKPVIVSNRDWQDLIGIQFALGGSNPVTGLNCYGLVREIYRGLQIELPEHQETTLDTATVKEGAGNDWTLLDEPAPFAVALIRSEGNASVFHLAIVTPELTLLHALPKKGVVVSPVEKYSGRIIGFYRYTPGLGQRLPLADGDAGRIIGTILIVAATIYTGGAAGAAYGAFVGAMAGAVVSIGGNMILNAIAPIKNDTNQLSGYGGDLADSRSYTWDGIQNDARQGLVKAMIFGRIQCGGQIISEKTWFDGANNEYLDMLLCPAVGRITHLENVQINDTSEALFKNTGYEYRGGDDQQPPIAMFPAIYIQYGSAAKIPYDASSSNPASVTNFTTKQPVSGIRITLTAPNGIYEMPSNAPIPSSVSFQIQYRQSGTAWWTDVSPLSPTADLYNSIFLFRQLITFTGSSNLFTLTDDSAYGLQYYNVNITPGADFDLTVADITYYCTQSGARTHTTLQFKAFIDPGRTTPLTTRPPDNAITVVSGSYLSLIANPQQWLPDFATQEGYDPLPAGPLLAMLTDIPVKGLSFHLYTSPPSDVTKMRVNIYYMKMGSTIWTLHSTVNFGTGAAPIGGAEQLVTIAGLAIDYYRIAAVVMIGVGTTGTISPGILQFIYIDLDFTSATGGFVIAANPKNPQLLASKQVKISGLTEALYDIRVWRTTIDHTEITWQDDIYLRGYAEIIARNLAYSNHALLGIRTMATDRLSGGRPRITSTATGAPLTVPPSRIGTTSAADEGLVSTATIIGGVEVNGMRKVLINTALPASTGYWWCVRMDSAGFAQADRLLTKYTLRVPAWEIVGGQTRLYIQSSESIPAGTPLLLFHAFTDPYVSRHTAWAVVKMLIDGSHGRITANSIHWESFAAWDVWNMELKNSVPRHLFDAVVDFNTDLWSLVMRVAGTARGHLIKRGSKYGVWIDRAATHRQIFGEGNSSNFSLDPIPRADRANILTTTFLDESAGYDQKDICREDVQGNEYPIVKSMPVQVGVVRESQVVALLDFMLAQNRYVGNMSSLEAGVDSIEVEVGDVYITASQAKDFALSGRIVTVNGDGTCTIDRPFTPEVGITYSFTVWGKDSVIYNWQGTLTGVDITGIPTPVGLVADDYYEYPYILSKLSEERMKFRCMGIKRNADTLQATITGIEYRDEIYLND